MKYLNELKKLRMPKDKFAVFGSGPMAIRNLRKAKDIDIIIVSRGLWNKLKKKHPSAGKSIKLKHIEIFKDWLPWIRNSEKLIKDADIINGIRFVKLEYVLKWKKAMNRPKDRKDVSLIEKYLKTKKTTEKL